ncbi:MAG TPA: rRNA maturation RNase YbeY [Patescibacteria group bacterium]|nr:rRNA maturation RNase YbeY [Patescibacteria group bacterium]
MISIALNNSVKKPLPQSAIINFLRSSLSYLKLYNVELSVAFVAEPVSRRLNRSYRGLDHSTDILSFVFAKDKKNLDGELVICYAVALRQARESGHALRQEIMRLLAHGLLHLIGYDHQRTKETAAMEKMENILLVHSKFN